MMAMTTKPSVIRIIYPKEFKVYNNEDLKYIPIDWVSLSTHIKYLEPLNWKLRTTQAGR